MKIIICLDDKNGMLFNKRRQSKDAQVRSRILQLVCGRKLWMNAYSKKQFEEKTDTIVVDEQFLHNTSDDDYCFVENTDITPVLDRIHTLVIYRWNRHYPSDTKAPAALFERSWKLQSTTEFPGSSHERITEEIFSL